MKKTPILASLVITVFLGGYFYVSQDSLDAEVSTTDTTIISERLGVLEFEQKYQAGGHVVIDVRTPEEYAEGRLFSDAILINFYDSDFKEQLDLLDKNQSYLIHCHSGARSGNTLSIMKELGFAKVYDLIGGKNAWVESGRELVQVN